MEDKKRQKDMVEILSYEPPLKKQVFENVLGVEEEVEDFQKEAIWRRMQEYKREAIRAKERVEELEKRIKYQDEHLVTIDAWFDEFLNEIYIYSGAKGTLEAGIMNEGNFPGLLFESDTKFKCHLSEKKSKIMNIAGSILNMVKSSCIEDTEIERIKNYAAKLSSDLTIARSYIEQLKLERENNEKKMEEMFYEIMSLEKKIDREKSMTLSKMKLNAMKKPQEEGSNIKLVEVTKTSKLEENKSNENIEAIEIKLKEMNVINEKRLSEISKLNNQNSKLREQLLNLELKLKNPSEEEIINSDLYYSLKSKYELCAAKIKEIEPAYESLNKEVEKLRLERLEFKEELLNEQRNIITDMRDQLSKVEQDLARVRTVRDELLSQLNIKKATEFENSTAKKELLELLETRNTRITALEEQLQRLNNQIKQDCELGNDVNLEKSKEELLKQIERLEKQNKSLSSELLALEQAFNKAHHQSSLKVNEIIAKEDKFYRLNADKAKADQKYFDAMKAKDKLTIENKTLKQQNSKAGDIIIKLQEAEKITMQKLIILEKQIAILRPANETLISKVHELQLKIEEKDHNIKNIGQQISMLKQRLIEQENITSTEIDSKRIAEEKIEKLKIQIQRNKNQNTVNGDIDELKIYKSMAKCSVCETKWKNTAISLCGHIFCKECINKRIETRQRRCPSCNRGFGSGDILQVHL
ncbi:hypothetical protein PNEG_00713 [Pneumocystis murina B123]|uniref:E3 ubiquitin protein ligase n=1 Tax=Pneumocystis murina (strain B123) TaxID=1069680 RepID=M7NVE9_PNEMU|nr:hypothetical protein PNEG_00713 [Pneumocystis murina B123]EMR11116.1 hypothetical protein PNEG_00713 [Pneumocystis murina B123]